MNPIDFFDGQPGIDFPATPAMRAIFRSAYGDPLNDEDREYFARLAADRDVPTDADGASEIAICAGRGSAKTTIAARFLVFEATQIPHAVALAAGQKGIAAIISTEKKNTSAELFNLVKGLCDLAAIKPLVVRMTDNEIEFSTSVIIRKLAADSKLLRGSRYVAAVVDEAAFLPWEGADPDVAILRALRGGMTRIEGAPRRKLLQVSSAGVKKGEFYATITNNHGKSDAPVLAFHGTTLDYNPFTSREDLAKAKARDAMGFEREYNSVFMDVIQHGFFPSKALHAAIDVGRKDAMPREDGLRYTIALDVAWSSDCFAIAVVSTRWIYTDAERTQRKRVTHVCDVIQWRGSRDNPLSPNAMLREVWKVAQRYDTSRLYLDQYNAVPLIETLASPPFRLKAKKIDWRGGDSEGSKPDRFRAVREALAAGDIRLPDLPDIVDEFERISSKALPSGSERIEAVRGTDDRVHAIVLAASVALSDPATFAYEYLTSRERKAKEARRARFARYLGAAPYLRLR